MINPTQKVHLHETGDTNPEMIGPMIGPKEVNCISLVLDHSFRQKQT